MAVPRDETGEWIVPDREVPTIGELEDRIEVAISIARSSEAAAMTVADAAIESAQQARRAAELAERAAATVAAGVVPSVAEETPVRAAEPGERQAPPESGEVTAVAAEPQQPPGPVTAPVRNGGGPGSEEWLLDFSRRADRLGARLAGLARV